MKSFRPAVFPAVVFLFLATPFAYASTIFTLNVDNCTGTCGTPPFGTVALDQVDPQTVLVSLTLESGGRTGSNGIEQGSAV